MDVGGCNLSITFPERFDSHMEILPDSVGAGVPETDSLDEGVGHGVVGKGEAGLEAGHKVAEVHQAVGLVVGACQQWHFEMVAGEDLTRLEDCRMNSIW